jgi:tetratricopeptide (TPR) repeat protein
LADLNLSIAEESNHDLAQVQAELHNTREELERLQSHFDEVLAELEQTHWQLHQVQTKQSDSDVTIDSDQQVIEVNPDDIQSYYRFLEVQPENIYIWLQLANILVEQNRLEDAIAAYRRLVELSPCEEYYQQLGELLVKQEKWDEAIIVYKRAIEFNPESYLYYYQLGEVIYNRVMQNTESFFVDYKIAELPHRDYQLFDTELPEVCFLNDHAFLQATAHLDDANYVVEVYRVYLRRTLSDVEKQGAINWLQTPGHSRELAIQVWRTTLEEFKSLFNNSILSVSLEEAIACFRRTIELNPYYCEAKYYLGEILAKQGKLNESAATYYQLSIFLAEQGRLDEAVACFQKAPQRQTEGDTYDRIWRGLNQQGLLDANHDYPATEIKQESAYQYFIKTTKYTVMHLDRLTDENKAFLEKLGLSLPNLELVKQDQTALEEIYINSFSPLPKNKISPKADKFPSGGGEPPDHWRKALCLHQSIVETGYIYSVCPFSGKILRSNEGLYAFPGEFYRFVGAEIFYLVIGEWYGSRLCLYFPRLELILVLYQHDHLDFKSIISAFKAFCVSSWKQLNAYFLSSEKELVAVLGILANPGHYLWNEVSGIDYIYKNGTLENVDKFIVGPYEYFYIDDIFPEIPSEKIIRVSDHHESLRKIILENNFFPLTLTDYYIEEEVAKRIYKSSIKKCSQSFLQKVEAAKKHSPLLWITLRNYKRKWISQVEGIANIINSLHSEYPNLGVVFDGWSLTERDMGNYDPMIATEKACLEQILTLLPTTIKTYSTIGCPLYETVVWADAIDLYIAPFGTGMSFVVWIANKPGVAHGNKLYYYAIKETCSPLCRENAISPVFVSMDDIIEDPNNLDPFTRNYDVDWRVIYNEVIKMIKELGK